MDISCKAVWDEVADVLYISLGNKPVPAVSEEVTPGVLIRRIPAASGSTQIIGITLLDWREVANREGVAEE